MASAVALVIGGAVVNALAFTGGILLFSKRGMTKQSNSWKQLKQPGVKENAKTGFY